MHCVTASLMAQLNSKKNFAHKNDTEFMNLKDVLSKPHRFCIMFSLGLMNK
ncbi:hypothetical protein EV102420_09_01850 [Pseudescherichia vulneris NBRC 102420]|uniref:Uncharacterized protein n=1 Tax=Pseudescherichia vulneris NBRC 102420 TaxID=1115515 RepID=A0A090V220_PSEVU|nr:hypothetical protein EV102420_09_01850 [Pseudescherichia vulneris NBRC 102420]